MRSLDIAKLHHVIADFLNVIITLRYTFKRTYLRYKANIQDLYLSDLYRCTLIRNMINSLA
jgi:hypothetical protein